MTPIQEKILYAILDIQNEQPVDSVYFKTGTASDNLISIADVPTIETEAVELEKNGYIKLFDLKKLKGLQLTQAGIDWVKNDKAIKDEQTKVQLEQQAQQEAVQQVIVQAIAVMAVLPTLPNYDQVVKDIFTRAKQLGL